MHKDNQRLLSGSVQLKGRICGQSRLCVEGNRSGRAIWKSRCSPIFATLFPKTVGNCLLPNTCTCFIYLYICVCVYIYIYFPFNTKGNLVYTLFDTLWAFQLVCFTWYTLAIFLYPYIESVTMSLQFPGIIFYGYTIVFSQFVRDGHLGFLPFFFSYKKLMNKCVQTSFQVHASVTGG